jgi:dihydroorotase
MTHDLILRGGTVVDPSQGLHAVRDVAVADGKIAAIAERIEGPGARTLDVRGKFVTPGLVDIHTHVYAGVTTWGVKADPAALRSGVTTLVDAGSPSFVTLPGFRWYIAEPAATRVLTFVHISGVGLVYGPLGEMLDLRYADPEKVAETVLENGDLTTGVKVRMGSYTVGDNGMAPLELAVRAAAMAGTRVMVHIASGSSLPEILARLRPGDIVTHCFQGRGDCIVDDRGRILPEVWAAREQGIIMDLAHGAGSFRWEVGEMALDQGFLPHVISTDLHAGNILGPVYDMPTTMSKMLHLGMSLDQIVAASTQAAAQAVGRPELGTLQVGSAADLAVLDLVEGEFAMFDTHGQSRTVNRKLVAVYTVARGRVFAAGEITPEPAADIRKRYYLGPAASEAERKLEFRPRA